MTKSGDDEDKAEETSKDDVRQRSQTFDIMHAARPRFWNSSSRRCAGLPRVIQDQLDEPGQQSGRQIVAHAFDLLEASARDVFRRVATAFWMNERIVLSMNHQGRRLDPTQELDARSTGKDRCHLARDVQRIVQR